MSRYLYTAALIVCNIFDFTLSRSKIEDCQPNRAYEKYAQALARLRYKNSDYQKTADNSKDDGVCCGCLVRNCRRAAAFPPPYNEKSDHGREEEGVLGQTWALNQSPIGERNWQKCLTDKGDKPIEGPNKKIERRHERIHSQSESITFVSLLATCDEVAHRRSHRNRPLPPQSPRPLGKPFHGPRKKSWEEPVKILILVFGARTMRVCKNARQVSPLASRHGQYRGGKSIGIEGPHGRYRHRDGVQKSTPPTEGPSCKLLWIM